MKKTSSHKRVLGEAVRVVKTGSCDAGGAENKRDGYYGDYRS